MSRERGDHTLDATALVHEAWMKLGEVHGRPFEARGQFMAVAAKAMRHVLVDHARARKALKRGGSGERVALDHIEDPVEAQAQTFLLVDDALKRLAVSDPLAAQVGELRLFGGLEHAEIAEQSRQSLRSVERTWRFVRAVLRKELGDAHLPDD
jgi:RNA polymerase sigma factor (TIGR02999 family)